MAKIDQRGTLDRIFKMMAIIALLITAIILLKDIVIPIAFASLFAIVLHPIAHRLEKKTGRILSITLVLVGSFAVVALLVWFVVHQLTGLVASLPDLEQRFYNAALDASQKISRQFNISTAQQLQYVKDGLSALSSSLGALLVSTSYLVYFFIQVPIYIFLFLLYREKFKEFFLAFASGGEMKWKKDIEGVVRGYISGLTIVVIIAGVLNSIGLLALGIDHAIFFGFLSGALTLIPYVGITLGAALPTLVAFITKENIWYPIGVILVHTVVQFLEGNFITPKVTGSKISINALAAILALLIGGKILGIAGMILAVPLVGILKILLSYSTSLRPFVILLGDEAAQTELPPVNDANETPEG